MINLNLLIPITLTIFLFSITVPNIIFTLLSEDVKLIYAKYRKKHFLIGHNLLIVTFLLVLIWSLHYNVVESSWLNRLFNLSIIKDAIVKYPFLSYALLSLICIYIVLIGINNTINSDFRLKIIRILETKILKHWHDNHIIKQQEYSDLIQLGIISNPGFNKQLVIDSNKTIVRQITASDNYTGIELEEIINHLEEIILNDTKNGNKDNFISICNIYNDILDVIVQKSLSTYDYYSLTKSIQRLSMYCLKKTELHFIVDKFLTLPSISQTNLDHIFEIGRESIKSSLYGISFSVFNTFIKHDFENPSLNQYSNLLGFLSYFYEIDTLTKEKSVSFIQSSNFLSTNTSDLIDNARNFFKLRADFNTAKLLNKLKENVVESASFLQS